MSKIRIYELAKELGVDNRIVIQKAVELGVSSKASHSSTLEDFEADQIRRAVIRQALGAAPDKEVVTTKVDKVTGETKSVVEKRKGNVIRRRRAADEEAPASSAGVEPPVADESPTVPSRERPAMSHGFEGGLAVAAEEHTGAQESDALAAIAIAQSVGAPVEESESREEPETDLEIVEPRNGAHAQGAAAEAVVRSAKTEAEPLLRAPATGMQGTVVDDAKKGPGPRVLGRIELPQKRVIAKPEPAKTGRPLVPPVVTAPSEDSEAEERARARRAKSKKREIAVADLADYEGRDHRRVTKSRKRGPELPRVHSDQSQPKVVKRVVKLGEGILVGELAKQMSVKSGDVIAKLMELGVLATINQVVDRDTAAIIAEEFGCGVESTSFDEAAAVFDDTAENEADLSPRPPVVTIMGHVDHGKTTLLDTIRDADVAAHEAGGITQHIGAYTVTLPDKRKITFIDTPGHAAFTQMRARGAHITDIVVLVVAADDGVMPQTVEAINHAKAANVPILVAVNKIDKPGANLERVKQSLVEHGLQPEDWGGDTMYAPVSALKKQGIKELLESLLLIAEVKELKANPKRRAVGTIVETRQERGRGNVATVLVQKGTLRVGDIFVAGAGYGRVRSMLDDRGNKIEEAGPSTPVEITGLDTTPEAGDDFLIVDTENKARDVSQNRGEKKAAKERANAAGPISLEEFAKRANNIAALELNVVVKGDVHGSVEAIQDSLEKLSTAKVKVKVLHAAVGGVNESDVQLAVASRALIIGFNVRGEIRAMDEAEQSGIEVRFYRIIYELLDDVRTAMAGLLPPLLEEIRLGRAEVRNVFNVGKVGTIAGCYITDGIARRTAGVRVLRDSKVVWEGKVGSLKRFKDDAREVQTGFECGVGVEGFNDVKVNDVLEFFDTKEVAQTLE